MSLRLVPLALLLLGTPSALAFDGRHTARQGATSGSPGEKTHQRPSLRGCCQSDELAEPC